MVAGFDSIGCALAHGAVEPAADRRALVAVFDSPVATHLMHIAATLGYRVALAEPDLAGVTIDAETDVVVCDHDRPELGVALQAALASPARWIGVMGSPRHTGPHIAALRELGVAEADIARVHRPIGLNIGSKTPAEIALATLAGLIADRNDRPGGFTF
ncbi:XdhC family protein [Dactylosporangium sp. AC04546]|uniref:XdhC family protein n=1 Tax=Dactylosporangium sp. AC04546 TaxID=2862460 RepID=UPI001EE05F14|nr:XdhC family protein [Dactylosporangium sp. AC04546]WVK82532.1 XdhC family protein [Dactylosporangium sp. AC04546]